jgi:hypothetical protein
MAPNQKHPSGSRRLTPQQRAYLLGYRRAKMEARQKREELASQFEDEIDDVHEEMHGISLNDAIDAERYPDEWLH